MYVVVLFMSSVFLHRFCFSRHQVVSGGSGCDDYTTDLSGVFEVASTGDWRAFETESTYVQLLRSTKSNWHHRDVCVNKGTHLSEREEPRFSPRGQKQGYL